MIKPEEEDRVEESATQAEPEPQPEPQPNTGGQDEPEPVKLTYKALAGGVIRSGAALDSAKVGNLREGEVIGVTAKQMVSGSTRVKFDRGWTSVLAKSGKTLLELVPRPILVRALSADTCIRVDSQLATLKLLSGLRI